MLLQGQVGSQAQPDGQPVNLRTGRGGELITANYGGFYGEAARRGMLYVLDSDAITLAAANTTKGAAATIKLVNGFVNPVGSGVYAEIIYAKVATVSGTPAGGYFWNFQLGAFTQAATGTIRNLFLGGTASAVVPAVNVIIARADAATTAFTQLASLGGPTAVAATGSVEDATDTTDGKIIVPPGYAFGIAATGAGTSHIVQSSLIWREVPITNG